MKSTPRSIFEYSLIDRVLSETEKSLANLDEQKTEKTFQNRRFGLEEAIVESMQPIAEVAIRQTLEGHSELYFPE